MRFALVSVKKALLVVSAAGGLAVLFVYLGLFNVAADVPHSALVYSVMEAVRDRSIAVRSQDVQVPPLDDPNLVAGGAEHYAAMCAGCHRAPGTESSEMRQGLYPQPPDLTGERGHAGPGQQFWVIKHGIKMSAMPAWGKSHDDQSIWGIVAFLQRLPKLTPEEYQALTKPSGEQHHHEHQHHAAGAHDDGGTGHDTHAHHETAHP
jgi:mono/diheme cytochrome c family protein